MSGLGASLALVRERLEGARSVCVLTGSGISSESGLPTFRGVNGLWRTHRVEELASPQGFARDPKLVWTWYNLREARCDRCGERIPLDDSLPSEAIEHGCGGRFRPDIVWFGEPLPPQAFERASAAAARADVVLVVGTSGVVYPAASLATRYPRSDALIVEINPEETPLSSSAGIVLRARAAAVLPGLLETEPGEFVSLREQ